MPFSHIGIPVGDHYTEMRDFYKAILEPLGYMLMVEGEQTGQYCGFGTKETGPDFWLGGGCAGGLKKYDGKLENRPAPIHVAFPGKNREHVDEWYEVAM